jgi:hypothetical protein
MKLFAERLSNGGIFSLHGRRLDGHVFMGLGDDFPRSSAETEALASIAFRAKQTMFPALQGIDRVARLAAPKCYTEH